MICTIISLLSINWKHSISLSVMTLRHCDFLNVHHIHMKLVVNVRIFRRVSVEQLAVECRS